jgi:hypothetical protein
MKNLLRYLAFALMVGGAFAQSNLPACQGEFSSWSDCFGTFTSVSGNKYIGEFKDGKPNGQGTATYTVGTKYVGEWKDGKRNGQGTATYPNGEKYIGGFKDDKRNGRGTYLFLGDNQFKGDKYVGEYKDDKRNGQGTFLKADGRVSLGDWKDEKPHGRFIVYRADKSIELSGIFEDGKFIRTENINPAIFTRISADVNPVIADSQRIENERLRVEAEDAKRRQVELEEQLRLAQQQTNQSNQPLTPESASKRIALVVGNANYKVRPLKNPRNDADDISRSLRSSGFEVIDLRDASLQQMRNGVRQFGDRLINNDVGLVYYSGHGVEVKGRNYFIPVNADIMREDEIADQGLDVSLILEKMNTAGKGVNILIVDACRDDPFGRSFRSSSRGLAQMDAPRGTIIAYATSPGKVASDGDPRERNSPYTKNLVKAMQQPNKPIEQVFKEVRRAVQEETKNQQTPWENTSLSGDFYFKVQR